MALYDSFSVLMGPVYRKTVTKIISVRSSQKKTCIKSISTRSLQKKTHIRTCFNNQHLKWFFRYCSPMEIHHALQEPQNATIDILAVVAAMDAYTVLSK
jgi:hypothetical protein